MEPLPTDTPLDPLWTPSGPPLDPLWTRFVATHQPSAALYPACCTQARMASPKPSHQVYTTAAQQRYGQYFTDALRSNSFPAKKSINIVIHRLAMESGEAIAVGTRLACGLRVYVCVCVCVCVCMCVYNCTCAVPSLDHDGSCRPYALVYQRADNMCACIYACNSAGAVVGPRRLLPPVRLGLPARRPHRH
eukprot:1853098-Pyramimonas_sp.AAC.1